MAWERYSVLVFTVSCIAPNEYISWKTTTWAVPEGLGSCNTLSGKALQRL